MQPNEIAKKVAEILDNKKADDVKVIRVRDVTVIADYFVIASANNSTLVQSLADEVDFQLSKLGFPPARIEGHQTKSWILLDYHSVIVHVFYQETRDFYDLERLWSDGELVDISSL